jgi:hypothetical protein
VVSGAARIHDWADSGVAPVVAHDRTAPGLAGKCPDVITLSTKHEVAVP